MDSRIKRWHRRYIRGGRRTPGPQDAQGAYRSELAGLLGITIIVWILERMVPDSQGVVVIGCDGLPTLRRSLDTDPGRLSTSSKHFDIIAALMWYWREMRSTTWDTLIDGLADWLANNNTEPDTTEALVTILKTWCRRPTIFQMPILYMPNSDYIYPTVTQLQSQSVNNTISDGWHSS